MVQETTKLIILCLLIQFIVLSKYWIISTLWNSCLVSFVEISIWLPFLYFGLFEFSMGCIWSYQYFYDVYVSTTPLFDKFHFLDSIIPFERPYWSSQTVPTLLKPFSSSQLPCWEFPLKSPFEYYYLLDPSCQTIHDRLPPQNNRSETTTDFYRFSASLLFPRLFLLLSLPLPNCCDSPVKETQPVIFVVHKSGFLLLSTSFQYPIKFS